MAPPKPRGKVHITLVGGIWTTPMFSTKAQYRVSAKGYQEHYSLSRMFCYRKNIAEGRVLPPLNRGD